ncbi:RagB/SusD family nutrient uptake outer membrane protein [Maribacter sp. 2304DJ31-5]|uniref:RagB/SusD family nutrient uptake outer membrane protein n=1 Tax=Maribacter sp. 2304DJ31-5 TaxID=3386273 RepID=UPI0039BD231C
MNIKNIIVSTVVLLVSFSCSEDFIDLDPLSDQSLGNFFSNGQDVEQAVIGAYDALQSANQYGGISGFNHFMEVRSDNSFNSNPNQDGGSRADFDNFSLDVANTWINGTWISCYDGINRCNTILNRIDAIEMDDNVKANRIGEVKFIRALTYFNLVRIWGDVPLITMERENAFDAFEDTRASTSAIYDQIIADLTDAIASLSLKADTDSGRATRGAAQALLGKVHLTLQDWSAAVSALESVVNSPTNYDLEANFADLFDQSNEFGVESIFEVNFLSGTNGEGLQLQGSPAERNNKPSVNYIDYTNAYLIGNPNDVRPGVSINIISGTDALTGKLAGIDDVGSDGTYDSNIIVIRYADVLLMLAEALNEIGYQASGDAFTYLNQVRSRAGASTLTFTDLPDQTAFRDWIAEERRLELAFENHRWFDLIRTGKALEVMNSAANAGSFAFTVEAHQLLYPIPQAQIDASGGALTPNPGY